MAKLVKRLLVRAGHRPGARGIWTRKGDPVDDDESQPNGGLRV